MKSLLLLNLCGSFSLARRSRFALLSVLLAALAGCGGGGGGDDGGGASVTGPVTISGKAVFASVPSNASGSLNYGAAVDKPIRGATVQLLDASGNVLATTTTNATGDYQVTLTTAQPAKVRVRAELKRSGSAAGDRDIKVLDNTSNNSLYVLDSAAFSPNAATMTQNLRAASGWGGAGYTGIRAAAPFAILDALYAGQAKVESAAPVNLPPLQVFWSVNNRPVDGDRSKGEIGTSFFEASASGRVLYILGAANTDTDEYDSHVIAHEFGHYLLNALSRDDSVGGSHAGHDKLDQRVAFSEGWGNAWSGIALDGPVYADSAGTAQAQGFSFNVSVPAAGSDRGAYSETTAQYLIWSANSSFGFATTYKAIAAMAQSAAFSNLYSYAAALKGAGAGDSAVTTLWASQLVAAQDAYGSGETNSGGNAANLPVYKTHTAALGVAQNYCVRAENDPAKDHNKLGEHIFIRFTFSGTHTLSVTRTSGAALTDPDFLLLKSDGTRAAFYSNAANVETATAVVLPTGTHAIALTDDQLTYNSTTCFNFTVQ